MVVVPDSRSAVLVRILEYRIARSPGGAKAREGFVLEEVIPGPFLRIAGWNIARRGQVPCPCVAIALITHPNRAVDVRHDRNGAGVAAWCDCNNGPCVSVRSAAGRVGPVKRRIDGQ